MIWIILLLACAGSLLYRLGGAKHYDKLWRRLGVPIVGLVTIIALRGYSGLLWGHLIAFLLFYAALTSYWDEVFGYDNMWVHGLGCGLAYLPYALILQNWIPFGIRCLVLMISFGLLNKYGYKIKFIRTDILEECSRGFLLIITLLFLT